MDITVSIFSPLLFFQVEEGFLVCQVRFLDNRGMQADGDSSVFSAQCMWSSTTHVGMGIATAKNGWVFVVGRYSPPGNFVGSKPY